MNKKNGFSLLEILIVIALIGILSAVVMPNLKRTTPRYERQAFIAQLNSLTQLAWQQALITHKTKKISVDIEKKLITVLSATGNTDQSGELIFQPITDLVQETTIKIPEQFEIKQFFVEGFDLMAKFTSSKTEEIWFYIIPEGMAQNIIINFIDTKDLYQNSPRRIGLVLNPFNAQFKIYDTFEKP